MLIEPSTWDLYLHGMINGIYICTIGDTRTNLSREQIYRRVIGTGTKYHGNKLVNVLLARVHPRKYHFLYKTYLLIKSKFKKII